MGTYGFYRDFTVSQIGPKRCGVDHWNEVVDSNLNAKECRIITINGRDPDGKVLSRQCIQTLASTGVGSNLIFGTGRSSVARVGVLDLAAISSSHPSATIQYLDVAVDIGENSDTILDPNSSRFCVAGKSSVLTNSLLSVIEYQFDAVSLKITKTTGGTELINFGTD